MYLLALSCRLESDKLCKLQAYSEQVSSTRFLTGVMGQATPRPRASCWAPVWMPELQERYSKWFFSGRKGGRNGEGGRKGESEEGRDGGRGGRGKIVEGWMDEFVRWAW